MATGRISVYVDPSPLLATTVRTRRIGDGQVLATSPANGLGTPDTVTLDGANGEYWIQVTGTDAQEGAYCTDPNFVTGDVPCAGKEPVDQ